LTYVTEEQRSRPGWIGRPNVAEILTGDTSPAAGRLDDIGEDRVAVVRNPERPFKRDKGNVAGHGARRARKEVAGRWQTLAETLVRAMRCRRVARDPSARLRGLARPA
jgi:hypothetical protein